MAALDLVKQLQLEVNEFASTDAHENSDLVRIGITPVSSNFPNTPYHPVLSGYRNIRQESKTLRGIRPQDTDTFSLSATTKILPDDVSVRHDYTVTVPSDSGIEDDVAIQRLVVNKNPKEVAQGEVVFQVRLAELLPQISAVTQMRLKMLSQSLVEEVLMELEERAREAIRGSRN